MLPRRYYYFLSRKEVSVVLFFGENFTSYFFSNAAFFSGVLISSLTIFPLLYTIFTISLPFSLNKSIVETSFPTLIGDGGGGGGKGALGAGGGGGGGGGGGAISSDFNPNLSLNFASASKVDTSKFASELSS